MCSSTTMLQAWSRRSTCSTRRELPRRWYNVRADMPNPPQPVLHPGTGEPVGPDDLAPLFPMELIKQEVSQEPEVAIPEEVLDIYRLWRPDAALSRAPAGAGARHALADLLQVRGGQPGRAATSRTRPSRRPTTTSRRARTRLSTETGAGQWGSALAFACQLFGLECKVYMVRISYEQKPFRRSLMETWGAEIVAEPVRGHAGGPRGPRRAIRTRPAASASRSPRRSRTRPGARTPRTPSAASSTTC